MSHETCPRGQRTTRRRPGAMLLAAAFVSSASPVRARAQTTEAPVGAPDEPPKPETPKPETPKPETPSPETANPPPAATSPNPAGSSSNQKDEDLEQQIDAALAHDATTGVVQNPNPSTVPGTAGAPASGPVGRAPSMNPELSLILDFAGAYFSGAPFETGAHDPHETGFTVQQLELSAGANVDPYFRFDGHIVFRTDEIDLEEAYGTTLGLPYGLQARFGQFLHRFGRINPTHPHTWDFVDQPWAIGRVFGAEGGRNPGVELSWLTPLPWYVELVGTAQLATGETTARSFYGPNNPGVHSFADLLYVPAIKQFFALSDDWSLSWGLSGAFGPNATGPGNRTDVYGTDVYLKFRPITVGSYTIVALQTEWLYRRREVPEDLQTDLSGYAQLFYRFAERWAVASRWDYASPTRARSGAPVDEALEADWLRRRNRVGLNVTFWPTEFSRLRLQGARDISSSPLSGWSAFLAVELVAGAHGAHAF